jgi:fatty acid desaturase
MNARATHGLDQHPRAARVEWPTLLLILTVYGVFAALTLGWREIPLWLLVPIATFTLALFGSLQHEVIHGHPTPFPRLNFALVWLPLALWLPLPVYASTHRAHHLAELTHPGDDPESWYIPHQEWRRLSPAGRTLLRFNNTFVGRLSIGPFISIYRCWKQQLRQLLRDRSNAGMLLRHGVGVSVVLGWVIFVAGMPVILYVLGFVLPSISLALLRSFVEHRHADDPGHRTAIVEGCALTRFLFLNNNYHYVHHQHPGLPWYRIPDFYRRNTDAITLANGGYRHAGYGAIARRYFLTPCAETVYPGAEATSDRR